VIPLFIWVPYFLKSWRVKQTFIVPYPDLGYVMPEEEIAYAEENTIVTADENMTTEDEKIRE
jgi:hypothetical protein